MKKWLICLVSADGSGDWRLEPPAWRLTFRPERASKLRQLDLLDYYLQRLDTFSPPLKSTPLISKITAELKDVRQKLAADQPLSQADVAAIQSSAHSLVTLIEEDAATASVR